MKRCLDIDTDLLPGFLHEIGIIQVGPVLDASVIDEHIQIWVFSLNPLEQRLSIFFTF